jgi:heme/copper-type cytochrome/quinol oxidase subunit 3
VTAPATTAAEVARAARARRAKPSGWWAMACLVATEAALFGCFIASYFYLEFRATHWPPPQESNPKLAVPLILMGVLVATSVPMQVAASAALRGRLGVTRAALFLALFVQSGYLAMQIDRFVVSLRTSHPEDDSYASITYTLVGGHHVHVAIGLLLDAFLLLRLAGGLTNYRAVGVQITAFYWHFVNALAIAVTLTTLSPSL